MKKFLALSLVVVMLLVTLTACGGSIEDYKANLEEAGYEVEVVEGEDLEDVADDYLEEGVVAMLQAQKGMNMVVVIECESSSVAEDAVDSMSAYAGIVTVEADGCFVLIGTADAVAAAKG